MELLVYVSGKGILFAVILMSAIVIWSPTFTSDAFAHTVEEDDGYSRYYHHCEGPCNPLNCHHGWAVEEMDSKALIKGLHFLQRMMHYHETMDLTAEGETSDGFSKEFHEHVTLEFIRELEKKVIIEGAYEDTKEGIDMLKEAAREYKRETALDQSLRAVQKGRDAQNEGHEDDDDSDVTPNITIEESEDGPETETEHVFERPLYIQPFAKPVPVPFTLELSI